MTSTSIGKDESSASTGACSSRNHAQEESYTDKAWESLHEPDPYILQSKVIATFQS
jgi:hypothetical protein